MRLLAMVSVFLSLTTVCGADVKGTVISRGPKVDLKKTLREAGTTVLLVMQDTSAMEQQFLSTLEKQLSPNSSVALNVVRVKGVDAPAAQQFSIQTTPTAVVFDRFGREVGRSSQPEEIAAAVRKGQLMGRIAWIDEDNPKAPEVYGAPAESLRRGLPGIIKTMSLRPEAVQMMNLISRIHFTDGFLKRREHEMIAAYVSAINKCRF